MKVFKTWGWSLFASPRIWFPYATFRATRFAEKFAI